MADDRGRERTGRQLARGEGFRGHVGILPIARSGNRPALGPAGPEAPAQPHHLERRPARCPSPPTRSSRPFVPCEDPELHRVDRRPRHGARHHGRADGRVEVLVALTVAGCPLRNEITNRVTGAVQRPPRRRRRRPRLHRHDRRGARGPARAPPRRPRRHRRHPAGPRPRRGPRRSPSPSPARAPGRCSSPPARAASASRSVTTNLAVALAQQGHSVGVIDADVWGFSIPRMLGIDRDPVVIDQMLLPPEAVGRALHLDGLLRPGGPAGHLAGPDAAQGPRAVPHRRVLGRARLPARRPAARHRRHRAVAGAVPAPGRGVRRDHAAAGGPEGGAARRRSWPRRCNLEVKGIIENMSWFTGDDGKRYELFGAGGGQELADELERAAARPDPAACPQLREGGDNGRPIAAVDPDSEAARPVPGHRRAHRRGAGADPAGLQPRPQDHLSDASRQRASRSAWPAANVDRRPAQEECFDVDVRIGVIQRPAGDPARAGRATPIVTRSRPQIDAALADDDGVLWLIDERGREVAIPSASVAYVEIGTPDGDRRIGFGELTPGASMTASAPATGELLFVTGKGGVGKTTVAASLGLLAAAPGQADPGLRGRRQGQPGRRLRVRRAHASRPARCSPTCSPWPWTPRSR